MTQNDDQPAAYFVWERLNGRFVPVKFHPDRLVMIEKDEPARRVGSPVALDKRHASMSLYALAMIFPLQSFVKA